MSQSELLQALAPLQQTAVLTIRYAAEQQGSGVEALRLSGRWELAACLLLCCAQWCIFVPRWPSRRLSQPFCLPTRPNPTCIPCRRGMQPGLLEGFSSAEQAWAFDSRFESITNAEQYWCCAAVGNYAWSIFPYALPMPFASMCSGHNRSCAGCAGLRRWFCSVPPRLCLLALQTCEPCLL